MCSTTSSASLSARGLALLRFRKLSNHCTKGEFEQKLREKTFSKVLGGQFPDGANEEQIRTRVSQALDDLEYRASQFKNQVRLAPFQSGDPA